VKTRARIRSELGRLQENFGQRATAAEPPRTMDSVAISKRRIAVSPSRPRREGTTFRFRLPMSDAALRLGCPKRDYVFVISRDAMRGLHIAGLFRMKATPNEVSAWLPGGSSSFAPAWPRQANATTGYAVAIAATAVALRAAARDLAVHPASPHCSSIPLYSSARVGGARPVISRRCCRRWRSCTRSSLRRSSTSAGVTKRSDSRYFLCVSALHQRGASRPDASRPRRAFGAAGQRSKGIDGRDVVDDRSACEQP